MKRILLLFSLISMLSCQTSHDCSYQAPVDLSDGLTVSTLEAHHLNVSLFDSINKDICEGKYGNIHDLLIIADNDLVVEQYYNGRDRDQLHFLASNTKSFNAVLTGIAIAQGKIKNVDQRMSDYFPEFEDTEKDSLKRLITIQHLLTMTSGFKWDELSLPLDDPDNMGVRIDQSDNWLNASLSLNMDTMPGTKYVYCGPNSIILGEIIKRSTGQDIAQYAEENLFKPLNIDKYDWFSKNGIYETGGGLKLKPRDIAKYGLLHLNKGKWNGAEIVPADWIEQTFDPYIEIRHPFYSCYQWQMVKTESGYNSWFIPGNGGQIIDIIPALNLVIVINADNRNIPKTERTPLEYLVKDIEKLCTVSENR